VSALDTASPLGHRIKGPSALGSDPRRFWHLTWTLAVTDWKLRFFGSALGYLWSVFRPLLLFGVLYAVFSLLLRFDIVPFYPEALLLGIVLFTFFSEATKGCVAALVAREPLVRKIEFPQAAVPLSVVLTALFNLGLNLIPVVIFLLADGGRVRWSWLELIPLVALLAVLAAGVGMLLSALYVRYRDIEPIWDVVLQVMFYAAPVFIPIEYVLITKHQEFWAHLMLDNPFAAILQQCRRALLGPGHLSLEQAIGGWVNVLEPVAAGVVLVALGAWIFVRRAPRMAEEL
jgi:ABC-2 type transport system permease protein